MTQRSPALLTLYPQFSVRLQIVSWLMKTAGSAFVRATKSRPRMMYGLMIRDCPVRFAAPPRAMEYTPPISVGALALKYKQPLYKEDMELESKPLPELLNSKPYIGDLLMVCKPAAF